MSFVMIFFAAMMTWGGFAPVNPSIGASPRTSVGGSGDFGGKPLLPFPGDDDHPASRRETADGRLVPFTLEIKTVPPFEGIPFMIDGRRYVTDEDGLVSAKLWREGVFRVDVLVDEIQSSHSGLEFARWGDNVFTPQREVDTGSSAPSLEAGFHVSYPVRLNFVDLDGGSVPPERISTVELRNSTGDVIIFEGSQSHWLQSIEVIGRDFGLDPVEVVYAVQRVTVDGSNVVNRGQQRFTVTAQEAPRIELLLYPVEITSRDALFRFPLGSGVRLEHPDGHQEIFPLDENGKLRLEAMARGTYRSTVAGAPGLAIPTTFVLSRAQEVEMIVISILDMVVVSLVGVLVFAGLIILGRPELLGELKVRVCGRTRNSKVVSSDISRHEDHS